MARKIRNALSWAGEAVGEHAFVAGLAALGSTLVGALLDKGTEHMKGKVGEMLSPEESLFESIADSRIGMVTDEWKNDSTWIPRGLRAYEEFYLSADEELQDRLEVFRRKMYKALSNGLGDPSQGTSSKPQVPNTLHKQYFAILGLMGEVHILSDLKKAEQAGHLKRAARKTSNALADLVDGLKGK